MKKLIYMVGAFALTAGMGCAALKEGMGKVKEMVSAPGEAVVTAAHALLNFIMGLFNVLLGGVLKAILPF